ncbi:unnamed protein product [Hydatigera taeniaeformis]|uniref:C2H2-type domain-containing protein n=1 Tax=Hydatigena taeniaeformis TaxID=6205 RepID=A0A3P7F8Q6_HYDTA|nr:unnamed protein product [Hydatigera taeniaeformis]
MAKGKHPVSVAKASNTSSRIMGRVARGEKTKTGAKRTRGRPRTKDPKPTLGTKRHKPSSASSANGTKSPQRDTSLSPTHQEPPQLEPMPAVDEDDDLDIPISFPSLISVDDHLRPGKCIIICPVANCRKKFSNPIELVSHLRVYHENDTFSSVKIHTCPICLKTRFSSHTTSSDLTLLSEHAARYHGQTLKQTEFIYFCTIVLDVVTGDKATQKKEENNLLKKEASCMIQQSSSDGQYCPILPLVPNSTATEIRADVNSPKVARVTTDSLGLRMPSAASHFIQISPMSQRLANSTVNSAAACTTAPQPVFAALAAVAGQLSTGGPPTLLLSSAPSTTANSVTVPASTTTVSEQPILIAPTGGICAGTNSAKPLPGQFELSVHISNASLEVTIVPLSILPLLLVLITSSSTVQSSPSDASQTNTMTSSLHPQSSNAAAAIATLKQLIQSASAAVKSHQSSPVVAHGSTSVTWTPAVVSSAANTFLSSIPSVQPTTAQPSSISAAKVVTKVEQPSSTPVGYPFVQGAAMVTSPGSELDSNSDLSSFASANADLLTLARLSVNQASAEAINNGSGNNSISSNNSSSVQETPPPPPLPPPPPPQPSQPSQPAASPTSRNRRLLPRKTTSATTTASVSAPILLRKRVALPPLAVKPPKESINSTPNSTALPAPATTQQPNPPTSAHSALVGGVGSVDSVTASDEAPVMTAALINPSCSASATTTLIPSSLGSMLAKSRLLQASSSPSTYISVQPRPAPLSVVASASNQHHQSSYQQQSQQQQSQQHLIQRVVPTIRPAPLQKILPRPNTTTIPVTTPTSISAPVTSTTSATVSGKEMRPLLYSVSAPLIAQAPVTVTANAIVTTQAGSGSVIAPAPVPTTTTSTNTPIKASATVSFSQVNGNGAAVTTTPSSAVVAASTTNTPNTAAASNSASSDEGPSALVICTSPSELK